MCPNRDFNYEMKFDEVNYELRRVFGHLSILKCLNRI
jgi:hypothetical protein